MGYFIQRFFPVIYLSLMCVKFCHSTQVISSPLDNQHVTVAAVEVYRCSLLFKYISKEYRMKLCLQIYIYIRYQLECK